MNSTNPSLESAGSASRPWRTRSSILATFSSETPHSRSSASKAAGPAASLSTAHASNATDCTFGLTSSSAADIARIALR